MLKLASRTQRDVKAKAVLHAIPNKNTFGDKLRQPEELLMISTPNVPISTPTQPVNVKAVPKTIRITQQIRGLHTWLSLLLSHSFRV